MKVASLCSGYGGLEMGVALVEPVEVIWHAEYEPAPAQVHAHHWPDAPNVGDITTADWSELEQPDLLTAGYPCQPFSTAGRRKGTEDDRHLWPHVAEAVRVLRPRRVLLENVAGHLTLGFGDVLGDLAEAGYDARWCCVRASDAGAPHRRERLFVVAYPQGVGSEAQRERVGDGPALPGAGSDRRPVAVAAYVRHERTWSSRGRRAGSEDGRNAFADADGASSEARRLRSRPRNARRLQPLDRGDTDWGPYAPAITRWERCAGPAPRPTDDRGRLNPPFVEWMMGLPAGHVTGHDLPRTAELKMLGNGVVPQAAAIAWRCLS